MPTRYLTEYAEPEIQYLSGWPEVQFDQVLVIPAYRETSHFFQQFATRTESLLIIVVINQPSDTAPHLDNIALADAVTHWGQRQFTQGNLQLFTRAKQGVLVVDRFALGQQIPPKQGVGLARKIGCDLALALHAQHVIQAPWIYSTDADAILPDDYFSLSAQLHYSAAVFPFFHQNDGSPTGQATALYQAAIEYFARGLTWAGSAYGYTSLGSALAVQASAYAKVRGFPKRAGGEDFYLLNKLAKVGPIYRAATAPILLEARVSSRVPFGTGPAVQAILALAQPEDYRYYAPELFVRLKIGLDAFSQTSQQPLRQCLAELPVDITNALNHIGIEALLQHMHRQNINSSQQQKVLHGWFDAFITLKFLRFLQTHYYPPQPLHACLQNGLF